MNESAKNASIGAREPWNCRSQLARIDLYLCRAYNSVKQSDKAIESGRRATFEYQSLVNADPDNYGYAVQLCDTHRELGQRYMEVERWNESIASNQAARNTLKTMALKHGQTHPEWLKSRNSLLNWISI